MIRFWEHILYPALLPPSAAGVFLLPADTPGRNPGCWAAEAAFRGLLATVLALSLCGLTWAVTRPDWAGQAAWRCWRHLVVLLVAFYLAVGVWAVWPG